MINIKRYIEKKEKGLVSIAKIGEAFAISQKQFDPETGEKIPADIQGYSIKELEKIKTELQKIMNDVNDLIADTNNLI